MMRIPILPNLPLTLVSNETPQYCSDGLVPHIVESEPQVYRGKAHNIPRKQKEENCGMKGGKSRSEGEKLEMFDDVNLKTMIVVTDC